MSTRAPAKPDAGRDEVEDLRRLDVREAKRIVFVCDDGRTRSVAAATMARAMAPRDIPVVAVAVSPAPIAPAVGKGLCEIGLSRIETAEALESFAFAAGDVVVVFDRVHVDAAAVLVVVDITVGDALDVDATLGQVPRGPALTPGDKNALDIGTRVRFALGLLRERTQALLAWTERDPADDDG